MYVLAPNNVVAKFPYSVEDLRNDNPNVSFPASPNQLQLAAFDVYPVVSVGPIHDPSTEVAEPNGCEYNPSRDRWETVWLVRDQTSEERAVYLANLYASIVSSTQARLDEFAQTRGYDNILSACTYATSPTQKFAVEGQYCVAQRDATWSKLYEILDEVNSGARPTPAGFEDIVDELPDLVWPN